MVFLGVDWAEEHHDACLLDEQGKVLGRARVANSLEGVSRIHALVADHSDEPNAVVVGIETDRGLLVQALLAAGYQIYAINPLAVDRYRDRHSVSGAKSDAGDAKVLADLVRTDRDNHRPVAGDSQQVALGSRSPGLGPHASASGQSATEHSARVLSSCPGGLQR